MRDSLLIKDTFVVALDGLEEAVVVVVHDVMVGDDGMIGGLFLTWFIFKSSLGD
jgi:hypothetical protein